MGYLSDVFARGDAATTIVELLDRASDLFRGEQWVEMDPKKLFDLWNQSYEKAAGGILDADTRAQANYWRNCMAKELSSWTSNLDQAPVVIDVRNSSRIAHNIASLFKNLESQLNGPPSEYRAASASVLKTVAADLWNKQVSWLGLQVEPLEDTVSRLRLAYAAGRASEAATLPLSLRMDPQESPGAYWGTKLGDVTLSAAEEGLGKAIYGGLTALHQNLLQEVNLSAAERSKALRALADNVEQMASNPSKDVRVLLPVLAESTREVLGCPRGPRARAQDAPSMRMTDNERRAIRAEVDGRSGWRY